MHCTTPAYFGSGAKLPSESDTRTSLNLVLVGKVGKVGKVGQTRALDFLLGARRRLALSVPKYVVPLLPAKPASTWPLRTRPRPGPVGSRGEDDGANRENEGSQSGQSPPPTRSDRGGQRTGRTLSKKSTRSNQPCCARSTGGDASETHFRNQT